MANLNITWSGATAEAGIKGYKVEWKKSTDAIFPTSNSQTITTTNQSGQALVENVEVSTIYNVRVKTIDNNDIESIYITKDINVGSAFMLQRSPMSSTKSIGVCDYEVGLSGLFSSKPIALLGLNDYLYSTINLDEKFNQNSSTRYWKLAHPDLQSNGRPHQIDSNGKIVNIAECENLYPIETYIEYKISNMLTSQPNCSATIPSNTTVYMVEPDLESINSESIIYTRIGSPSSPTYIPYFGGTANGGYYVIRPTLIISVSDVTKIIVKLFTNSKSTIEYVVNNCYI